MQRWLATCSTRGRIRDYASVVPDISTLSDGAVETYVSAFGDRHKVRFLTRVLLEQRRPLPAVMINFIRRPPPQMLWQDARRIAAVLMHGDFNSPAEELAAVLTCKLAEEHESDWVTELLLRLEADPLNIRSERWSETIRQVAHGPTPTSLQCRAAKYLPRPSGEQLLSTASTLVDKHEDRSGISAFQAMSICHDIEQQSEQGLETETLAAIFSPVMRHFGRRQLDSHGFILGWTRAAWDSRWNGTWPRSGMLCRMIEHFNDPKRAQSEGLSGCEAEALEGATMQARAAVSRIVPNRRSHLILDQLTGAELALLYGNFILGFRLDAPTSLRSRILRTLQNRARRAHELDSAFYAVSLKLRSADREERERLSTDLHELLPLATQLR